MPDLSTFILHTMRHHSCFVKVAVNLLSNETIAASKHHNTIQARMQMYQKYAVPLAEQVARKALLSASATTANIENSIHLIVFVSSTGFVAPGVDT